eukprot:5038440-Karenia_brevis.AAC.1
MEEEGAKVSGEPTTPPAPRQAVDEVRAEEDPPEREACNGLVNATTPPAPRQAVDEVRAEEDPPVELEP